MPLNHTTTENGVRLSEREVIETFFDEIVIAGMVAHFLTMTTRRRDVSKARDILIKTLARNSPGIDEARLEAILETYVQRYNAMVDAKAGRTHD